MKADAETLFSLRGKTAVLTGASGFLGRAFAQALLQNGARVVAIGRSARLHAEAEAWAKEFGADRVLAKQADMYDLPAFEALLKELAATEPRVDVVINNAFELGPATGFNTPVGTLDNADADQWLRSLTGGVYWAALTTRILGGAMKTRGGGSIVNIATMYARVAPSPRLYEGTPYLNPPGYSAAKAGLVGLTRYTASFWGPFGVRANAILPGPFSNTEDQGPNSVGAEDPFLQRLRDRTCLGRIGRPQELLGALLFLASDASSFVTGQEIVVDGGWTVT